MADRSEYWKKRWAKQKEEGTIPDRHEYWKKRWEEKSESTSESKSKSKKSKDLKFLFTQPVLTLFSVSHTSLLLPNTRTSTS